MTMRQGKFQMVGGTEAVCGHRRVATALAGISAAALLLLPTPAAKGSAVVAQFKVSVSAESTDFKGSRALLVRSITLRRRGIGKTRPAVKCNQQSCVRLASEGNFRKRRSRNSVVFSDVNLILKADQSITVAVHQGKRIGRFLRLGPKANGDPVIVIKKSGCLRRAFARRRCPSGTRSPAPETVVSPPAPPRNYFLFAGQWTHAWESGKGTDLQPITGDFNGDGVDDVGLRRISTGMWYFRPGPRFNSQWSYAWESGKGTDLQPITGDFNGDGVDDIGLRRISTGMWYFRPGPGFTSQSTYTWAGGTHLEPFVGQFDGDRVSEIGLRRISTGMWYFRPGPTYAAQRTYTWSSGSDTDVQPIVGDFNGDGVDEIGLRRIATGMWYFRPG